MFTCGIPLFLLEVSIGQYLGVGGMSVIGQICPIFKGVGYSAIAMVFLECVYYVIIVAWTMFYILNLLYNIGNGLPWDDCAKGSTYTNRGPKPRFNSRLTFWFLDGTWAGIDCYNPDTEKWNESAANLVHHLSVNETMPPVESYWK